MNVLHSLFGGQDAAALKEKETPPDARSLLPEPAGKRDETINAPEGWHFPTIPTLLSSALPSCALPAPKVVIIGAQASGKTKMLLSFLLHYLLPIEGFTADMGAALLRVLPTGPHMVTMRPVEVRLIRSPGTGTGTGTGTGCSLQLRLGEQTANFPSYEFDALLASSANSSSSSASLQAVPLQLLLSSPALPNISFTDLPGITTLDRYCGDSQQSVRALAMQYASDGDLLVVVETARQCFDMDTSLVVPLVAAGVPSREDIFQHAVLVLTKCDMVVAEQHEDIRALLTGTCAQMPRYPFQHVVGVINKFSGDPEPHAMQWEAFVDLFQRTQAREAEMFQAITEGLADAQRSCSTRAVLQSLDEMMFRTLPGQLQSAQAALTEAAQASLREIYLTTSPPSRFYTSSVVPRMSLDMVLEEFIAHAQGVVRVSLEEHYKQRIGLCEDKLRDLRWMPTIYGNLIIAEQQQQCLQALRDHVDAFIDGAPLDDLSAHQLFAYSSWHDIQRFPVLCSYLLQAIFFDHAHQVQAVKGAVHGYLSAIGLVDVLDPAFGQKSLLEALRRACHMACSELDQRMHTRLLSLRDLGGEIIQHGLLEEDQRSVAMRRAAYAKHIALMTQLFALQAAYRAQQLADLRSILQDCASLLAAQRLSADGIPLFGDQRFEEWEQDLWANRLEQGVDKACSSFCSSDEAHEQPSPNVLVAAAPSPGTSDEPVTRVSELGANIEGMPKRIGEKRLRSSSSSSEELTQGLLLTSMCQVKQEGLTGSWCTDDSNSSFIKSPSSRGDEGAANWESLLQFKASAVTQSRAVKPPISQAGKARSAGGKGTKKAKTAAHPPPPRKGGELVDLSAEDSN